MEAKRCHSSCSSDSTSELECCWCNSYGRPGPKGKIGPRGDPGFSGPRGEIGPIGRIGVDGLANIKQVFFALRTTNGYTIPSVDSPLVFDSRPIVMSNYEINSPYSTVLIKSAGTYSFIWEAKGNTTSSNWLRFNDTSLGDYKPQSLFSEYSGNMYIYGQVIVQITSPATTVQLIFSENNLEVTDATFYIEKLV